MEGGYFADIVKKGKDVVIEFTDEFCLQLSSAALDHTAKEGRTTLYCQVSDAERMALCTLEAGRTEQWNLTQMFTPTEEKVTFSCEGPNSIHLTGLIDVGDDEDYDSEDMDDLEAEEVDDAFMKQVSDKLAEIEGEAQPESESEEAEEVVEKKPVVEKKKETKKVEKKPVEAKPVEKKEASPETPKESKKNKKKKEKATPESNKKRQAAEDEALPVPKKMKSVKIVNGVSVEEVAVGKGPVVKKGKRVKILYRGTLQNGKQFDANKNRKNPFAFRLGTGDVIKGMDIGVQGMRVGGKRTLTIPAKLG